MPDIPTVKECVNNDQKVRFSYYRAGNLYYRCENGLEFPVPISDIGEATFLAEDKAILFMRYIKWQLKELEIANR